MDTYIFDAVRTPRGKGSAKKGALKDVKPVDLLSQLYGALESRTEINDQEIDSVILGCVGQVGGQGANISKVSTLYHNWGHHMEGMTVNTFCTSALTAIGLAHAKINAGMTDLVIAGGIEMLSSVPMFADKGAWFSDDEVIKKTDFTHMGVSADLIASLEGFSREELDDYAIQSHRRAAYASQNGYFSKSLIPVLNNNGETILEYDECIRPTSSKESMQRFEPVFSNFVSAHITKKIKEKYPQVKFQHLHHIGNSPTTADGACLLLLGSLEKGKALGLKPRAKIRAFDSTSCEPLIMLLGGQYAVQKAVKKAGLKMENIDLHNFAEAFSATCLKYQRDLNIDPEKFNVNGCTMSMGHAQGASGAMIATTLLDEMERRGVQFGVAGISGGAGLGAGIVLERI